MVDEINDPGLSAYLDDVILHKGDPDAHVDLLERTLEAHYQSGIKLKAVRLQSREPVECEFRWGKFNFELVEQQVYGNPFRNTVYFGNH